MSKLQPSRLVAFNVFKIDDREKDDWMELICLKLKEKGDEKQREHANFTKAQSLVSLSLQLPSRILYVYRQTDCVACRAVCVRRRWSLYQVYQRFSVVLKTNSRDDSLYLYYFYYKAFLFTFFVYPMSDERYKISSYGCRYKPCFSRFWSR